ATSPPRRPRGRRRRRGRPRPGPAPSASRRRAPLAPPRPRRAGRRGPSARPAPPRRRTPRASRGGASADGSAGPRWSRRPPPPGETERLALGARPRAPRPESVDREVAGDAEEPGRERPRGVVSVEVLPHPHERELRDVPRVLGIPEHPPQEREDAGRPTPDE